MPTKQAAIQAFMESFGMPAYSAASVPDDARMPYITYTAPDGMWGDDDTAVQADIWMRTGSEAAANAKAAEVGARLARGGVLLACDGGAVWPKRGRPFSQPIRDVDATVKRRLVNIQAEYLTTF